MVNLIWIEFDADKNGKLNRAETLKFINKLYKEQGIPEVMTAAFDKIFKTIDWNKDGFIQKKEMINFLKKMMAKEESKN
jgi:Ca2+-binding EF-hand superfamily protein